VPSSWCRESIEGCSRHSLQCDADAGALQALGAWPLTQIQGVLALVATIDINPRGSGSQSRY